MESLLPLVTKYIFGIPPSEIRWVHVALLGFFAMPAIITPLARLIFHRQKLKFLSTANREQREAYLKDPPSPPGMAGPLLLLFILGAGLLAQPAQRGLAEPVQAGLSLGPAREAPAGPMCEATDESSDSSRTCCKGGCEPGSRCNPKSCQCEARAVSPEAVPTEKPVIRPSSSRPQTHFAQLPARLEADLLVPLDWDPVRPASELDQPVSGPSGYPSW